MGFIHDLIDVVWALRWVLVVIAFVVLVVLLVEKTKQRNAALDAVAALDVESERLDRRIATARHVRREVVIDFINERPDYVNALEQGGGDVHDLQRWRGNAEARRMLATRLGLTVPHHRGERAEFSTTYARAVNR